MSLQSSGSFRRFAQRDDRRRRLLADELSNPSDWPACPAWPESVPLQQRSEHYGDGEFLEGQLRLLDLVPRRIVSLLLLLAAAVAILAGLEAAYAWMLDQVAGGAVRLTAFDLAAKGSLLCWFSSLALMASAVAAMLVYSVRRHRVDDYQGRYRIWLWAAACWFLLATNQAASLNEGFRELMVALTGTALVGDGALWWVVLCTLVLGAVGSRLLMDMLPNLPAIGFLLVAAIAHGLAVAGHQEWMFSSDGARKIMLLTGVETTGNLSLLAAMILAARYVILDAEGLLLRREPQWDDEEPESASVGKSWRKVDPPHTVSPPAFRPAAASVAAASLSSSPTSTISPVNRKLTKAERKALKEKLLRERLARQRQGG